MNGQRIGYIRVSTFDQNPERQREGVQVDRPFTDKASGKDAKRAQLVGSVARFRARGQYRGVVLHSIAYRITPFRDPKQAHQAGKPYKSFESNVSTRRALIFKGR